MNILVIGGTGILSTDLVKTSLDNGYEVYMLNRGKRSGLLDSRAHLIKGDIRNESVDALAGKLNVVSFGVVVDFLTMELKHLEKMKQLLSLIDYRQYIFISSATAYETNGDSIITEDTNIGNEQWDYAFNKSKCEWDLEKTDINYTIIRPYVTYSKTRIPFQFYDYRYYTIIKRIVDDKPFPLINGGKNKCTITHTIDFANILVKLFLNPKAYRQAFHITDRKVYTWLEVYQKLCELLGKNPCVVDISLDEAKKLLKPYYKELSGDKAKDMVFDSKKVIEAVGGYDFNVSLAEGLKMSIDYFSENISAQALSVEYDANLDYAVKCKKYKKRLKPICSQNKLKYFVLSNRLLRPIYLKLKKR